MFRMYSYLRNIVKKYVGTDCDINFSVFNYETRQWWNNNVQIKRKTIFCVVDLNGSFGHTVGAFFTKLYYA